jgi:hypothetical protein
MKTRAAITMELIELSGYSFIKCNRTDYWVCQDDSDLSEVAAARQLGTLIWQVADLLGV